MLSADRNVGWQQKAVERAAGEVANSKADRVMVDARDDSEIYWDGLNDVVMQDDVADLEGNTSQGSHYHCTDICADDYIICFQIYIVSIQKKVTMISIMMQSTNQKCNALELVIGIFLHSCNTPQKVIQALAHMGLSVSIDLIHSAVAPLSQKPFWTLCNMGQTLLVGYTYDNFDID